MEGTDQGNTLMINMHKKVVNILICKFSVTFFPALNIFPEIEMTKKKQKTDY